MKQEYVRNVQLTRFNRSEGYKVFISVLFGLLGLIGAFFSIRFNYGNVDIIINWSLIFPLMIAMAWGRKFGCISILFGLTVFYPLCAGRYNGWACLASSFCLLVWVIIQGYGSEKRFQARKFYTNTYFLQFIYSVIRVFLYFTLVPFLYRFNPPFWYPAANPSISYDTIIVFAIKSITVEFVFLAISDVLLLLPFIRKIFEPEYTKTSRYNTGIVLFTCAASLIFNFAVLAFNFFILEEQSDFQWLLSPLAKISFLLGGLSGFLFGGIIARVFRVQLETKEVLKESEEKYHTIFENINDIYIETTLNGAILTISPSVKKVLGYIDEDLIGTNINDLYFEPEQRKYMIETLLEEKEMNNYPIALKGKKGHKHSMWANMKVIEHGDGGQKLAGIVRDVTQYMEARSKQKESEKNYKLLLDKMLNCLFVIEPVFDENKKLTDICFVDFNPAFDKNSSIKTSGIIGKTWFEIYGFQNRYLEIYEKVFLTGMSQSFIAYNPDLESQYCSTNAFMINENRVGVIFENITERVKADNEVKRLAASLSAIFESTRDNIWLINENCQMITCNQAFTNSLKDFTGVDVVPGTKAEEIVQKKLAEVWDSYYIKALDDGPFTVEETVGEIVLEASFNPIYKDGKATGVAIFCKDITQRKLAEQEILKLNTKLEQRVIERTAELQTAVSELEAFAYTVSHDLKSPLRAIDAYSRIMLEDYPQQMEGEMEGITGYIRNISKDMIALIDKLLQYSTASSLELNKESIDLNELFNMIFHELASAVPERNIKLIVKTQLPQVTADKILIKQVIYNAVSNAIKFTKTRDTAVIEVGHTIDKNEAVIYIRDNGVGFDMELNGKLFGIFQRLHVLEEFEGTGIGLATVRKIIKKHGGITWIEGKPDKGAALYFTLPLNI